MFHLITRNHRIKTWIVRLAAAWLAAGSVGATAAPVAYKFGGVITSADGSTGVAPGTRYTGTLSYDPASLVPLGPGLREGYYPWNFSVSNLTLQVGGQTIADTNNLGITESYGYGPLYPQQPITSLAAQGLNSQFVTTLWLENSSSPSSPDVSSLPGVMGLDHFAQAHLDVVSATSGTGLPVMTGTIDSLTPLSVPEPGALALPAMVAAGLGMQRLLRRRRR